MKKTFLGIFASLGIFAGLFALTAADTAPSSATYVPMADLQATLKRAPVDSATDQEVRVVNTGKQDVGVGVVYRSAKAAQSAVQHDNITEVYEILEGSGTLMTGGQILGADGKPATTHDASGPSGPSLRGASIRGGETRQVHPGDIVIIPPGVPHIFTSINGAIKYAVVRVDPDRVLPLK